MNITLTGKTALVGGSSAGIGKAIAQQLAASGASVVLMARSEDRLKAALKELPVDQEQHHRYIVTDFEDYDQHHKCMARFFSVNHVDILVNNTNGPAAGGVFTKTETDYQRAFELLFQNAVNTTRLALPHMRNQGFGRIINVSSMTVKEPSATLVLSNTMRTALVSWSKTLASAVASDGITVNSILTGFFDTDRLNSLLKQQADDTGIPFDELKRRRIEAIPVKRLGDPREYGSLVAFLASEYASFLTGAAIPMDGGAAVGLL